MIKPKYGWPQLTTSEWLQTGWANLIQIINRESPSMLEIAIASWECIYGLVLVLPWNVFATSPSVYRWMQFAPQSVWGAAILAIGISQVMALAFDKHKSRRLAAQISCGMWGGMYFGWLASSLNMLLITHRIGMFPSPFGAWVFFLLTVSGVIQYKLAPVRERVVVHIEKIGDSRTVVNVSN